LEVLFLSLPRPTPISSLLSCLEDPQFP
jgi:hypothetical protein